MPVLQIIGGLALGAVATWLVYRWIDFVGNTHIAFLIGFPILLIIGLIGAIAEAANR
jgi:hypothetical protein